MTTETEIQVTMRNHLFDVYSKNIYYNLCRLSRAGKFQLHRIKCSKRYLTSFDVEKDGVRFLFNASHEKVETHRNGHCLAILFVANKNGAVEHLDKMSRNILAYIDDVVEFYKRDDAEDSAA